MKLHADKPDSTSITGHGDGWVAINGQRHASHVIVSSDGQVRPWACEGFGDLSAGHFAELATATHPAPEVVIFGSGRRLRFAPPALSRGLLEQRIGFETMDTAAACRTFNILAGEGRRVVAALLVEPSGDAAGPPH